MSDLRYAYRQLVKSPAFTLTAVLTLALGIGATTAVFSILNSIAFAPLPYREADRIVQLFQLPSTGGRAPTCGGAFIDWQDHASALETIAMFANSGKNLSGGGLEPTRLNGFEVSADFLTVLGVQPQLGRGISAKDDGPGGDRHVLVISDLLWRKQFHNDPNVLGKTVQLDLDTYTIIGVLPPHAFTFAGPPIDFLAPATIRVDVWKQSREYHYVCATLGRLKPGATPQQVSTELTAVHEALKSEYPAYQAGWKVAAVPLREALFGGGRTAIVTLLASVGAVLLITCVNVANLLLAKAAGRQGEIAVRLALGASAGRIVRQLLTESVLLAILGSGAGLALAQLTIRPIARFTGLDQIDGLAIGLDWRVVLFALLVSVLTGVIFGLVPALSLAKANVNEYLKDGARSGTGRRGRLQAALVVVETALTVVLLVATGLLLHSMINAVRADPGFRRDHLLVFDVSPRASRRAPGNYDQVLFIRDLSERIRHVPGVEAVGRGSTVPMNGTNYLGGLINRTDRPDPAQGVQTGYDSVAGDYFQALGIKLHQGRFITDADSEPNAAPVIVVNEALAHRLFGDENPLGSHVRILDVTWEIVGVVNSVREFQLDVDPVPHVYFAHRHFPWTNTIVVQSSQPPLTLVDAMRHTLSEIDPDLPLINIRTMEDSVAQSLRFRSIMLVLICAFGAAALALACVGIYGVMSYSVTQRIRELGIRIALGATSADVRKLILGKALALSAAGVAVGVLVSFGTNRLLASQLFGTAPFDPIPLAIVAFALMAAAIIASWLPARRAMRIAPTEALRAE